MIHKLQGAEESSRKLKIKLLGDPAPKCLDLGGSWEYNFVRSSPDTSGEKSIHMWRKNTVS